MLFPRRIGEQIYFIGHGQTVFIPASGKESVFHSLHNKVNAKIGEVFSMNSINENENDKNIKYFLHIKVYVFSQLFARIFQRY